MKISVVVPVYNVELYLERCLDSLLNQTFNDYEIVCVNDCSPDNSIEILRYYEARYPERIVVLENERNLGLGRTREHALEYARGEYVMFVDSDDYVKNDYLETYFRAASASDADIIVGGYIRDVEGKLSQHIMPNSVWSTVTYALACTKLFKISFLRSNHLNFSDIACGEDIFFSLSAYCCNATYEVIPYAGYFYYFNSNSITGTMTYKKNHERMMSQIFSMLHERYDLASLSEEKQRVIEYAYIANMVNALAVFNRGCGVKLMEEKLAFVKNDAEKQFPNWKSNPYIGFLIPKGQTLKIRLGVGGTALACKLHLIKPLFYLFAITK
ncbi:glycosyltransferase family 2 protein [Enorma massiliensis]|uniref:glycosyltransferase family 2 protein n=1 Tax=Enorma massiliensis TaxID=1472761 RepID=UPI0023EFCD85|nr:glycosyltransferase family 2 protein [Enorma massiliensis]